MFGQALNGGAVEQFIGVVERQAQAPVAVLFAVQLQVELGFAAVPRQLIGEQARQAAQGTQVTLLVVEHHLEQALLTRLGEGLQQLLERQVLMGLGVQCSLACRRQQLVERQAPVKLGTQHQGVDEETDQAMGFLARAIGIGHADADIALAAVAIQQGLERGQQQHERGGFMGARGLANRGAEGRVQAYGIPRGAVAHLRRAWVVGGQVEGRMLLPQRRLPVRQLPLAFTGGQPLALPAGVVGVLQGQWRQLKGLALDGSGVQPRELVNQDSERPAIGDDVVQRHQQLMVLIVQTHQGDPQQRAFLQVEPGTRLIFADLLRTRLALGIGQVAEVDDVQREIRRGLDTLKALAIALVKACTQGFVALDQLLEA
ncbi:hypothetical protein [Pseudomonas sp. 34 E 7]|nr:hypothetical protein [Pseudomonas sp. 34 E 7]